jgi:glyoxylase-like metal-dependent hydrolase (beta-lactamase superfamily II)
MATITDTQIPVNGLHASTPQPLPFAPSLAARAFLLQRDAGNVLVYSNGELARDAEAFTALGGIERQYLNHWHESLFGGLDGTGLDAPLFVHRDDASEVEQRDLDVRGTFSRRHHFDEDLEVIPIPGHTPGATAYLWETGDRRVLFTGDTLYLDGGRWVAAVLSSSDRARYLESLELLRDVEFDVLVPWAASVGQPPYVALEQGEGAERIDEVLTRLRAGENA